MRRIRALFLEDHNRNPQLIMALKDVDHTIRDTKPEGAVDHKAPGFVQSEVVTDFRSREEMTYTRCFEVVSHPGWARPLWIEDYV